MVWQAASAVNAPVAGCGAAAPARVGCDPAAPTASASAREPGQRVVGRRRQLVHLAADPGRGIPCDPGRRRRTPGPSRRRARGAQPSQLHRSELRQVGEPLGGRHAGAALDPRRERLGEDLGPGRSGDLRSGHERRLPQRASRPAAGPRRRDRAAPWRSPRPRSPAGAGAGSRAGTTAGSPPSDQETSAGRMRVATWPGGPVAAVTASAASAPTSAVLAEVRTQPETLRATVSMSDCSWAS